MLSNILFQIPFSIAISSFLQQAKMKLVGVLFSDLYEIDQGSLIVNINLLQK
jgi:hypothetical protein